MYLFGRLIKTESCVCQGLLGKESGVLGLESGVWGMESGVLGLEMVNDAFVNPLLP